MQIRFKHLVEDRDRHGNIRLYVRVSGRRKVRIRAPFGTDEFIAAYNAAVSNLWGAAAGARSESRGLSGISAFCTTAARCSNGSTGYAIVATAGVGCDLRKARRQTGGPLDPAPYPYVAG